MYRTLISFLVIFGIIIGGCKSSTNSDSGYTENTLVRVKFVDSSGSSLLNPDHNNAITEDNTDLYYVENDQEKRVYNANYDHPKNLYVSTESENFFMAIFPNILEGQDHAVTHIKFDNYSTDTLEVKYIKTDELTSVTKVWYNGDLKVDFNDSNNSDRTFQVTKSLSNN